MIKERLCKRICKFILKSELKIIANLTRDAIAKKFKVPSGSLSAMFKKEIGITIGEYISSMRINRAENMIKARPDLTINNISKMIGIETLRIFRKKFKQKYGLLPGEYRKFIKEQLYQKKKLK